MNRSPFAAIRNIIGRQRHRRFGTHGRRLEVKLMTGVDEKDLFTAAYAELHRIARRERRRVSSSATINTTALVHET